MKRVFIILAAFGLFTFATANAQTEPTQTEADTTMTQENKTEIQFSELPEAVQTGFQDSEYGQWETSTVYEVTTEEGTAYEITVSDGSEEKTLMFDESGTLKENEE